MKPAGTRRPRWAGTTVGRGGRTVPCVRRGRQSTATRDAPGPPRAPRPPRRHPPPPLGRRQRAASRQRRAGLQSLSWRRRPGSRRRPREASPRRLATRRRGHRHAATAARLAVGIRAVDGTGALGGSVSLPGGRVAAAGVSTPTPVGAASAGDAARPSSSPPRLRVRARRWRAGRGSSTGAAPLRSRALAAAPPWSPSVSTYSASRPARVRCECGSRPRGARRGCPGRREVRRTWSRSPAGSGMPSPRASLISLPAGHLVPVDERDRDARLARPGRCGRCGARRSCRPRGTGS